MEPIVPECALAVIGLPAVLRGEARWGIGRQDEAIAIPRAIERALRAFLGRGEPGETADLPPFDYEATRALLDDAEGNAAQAVAALVATITDSELAQGVIDLATGQMHMLTSKMPRNVRDDLTGAVPCLPSPTEVARFARCWHVAADPMVVFRDLEDHSLAFDQALAFAAFFPELYETTKALIVELLTTMKAKRKTWTLDRPREHLLRILIGAGDHNTELATDFQTAYAQDEAARAQPQQTTPGKLKTKNVEGTPGQTPIGVR